MREKPHYILMRFDPAESSQPYPGGGLLAGDPPEPTTKLSLEEDGIASVLERWPPPRQAHPTSQPLHGFRHNGYAQHKSEGGARKRSKTCRCAWLQPTLASHSNKQKWDDKTFLGNYRVRGARMVSPHLGPTKEEYPTLLLNLGYSCWTNNQP